jgi:TPR repeat protein
MISAFRAIVAAIMLVLSLAAPVAAGPFEDAVAANKKGDYATALQLLRPLADQGNALAQFNLAAMYAHGHGVPENLAEAAKWFRKAAEQGDALAQNNLGFMYAEGKGVPKNFAESVTWYRRSADHGFALAKFALGEMYLKGQGVPQSFVLAHMWFNLAAAQDVVKAIQNRDLVAQHMSPAQIAEAQKLAREWKPKSIAKNPWLLDWFGLQWKSD